MRRHEHLGDHATSLIGCMMTSDYTHHLTLTRPLSRSNLALTLELGTVSRKAQHCKSATLCALAALFAEIIQPGRKSRGVSPTK